MKSIVRIFILIALVSATAGTAAAADLTGSWQAEFETMIGTQKYVYTFKAEGEKITGSAKADIAGEACESTLTEVVLDGENIRFVELLNYQGMDLTITYKGTVKGDEMTLERQVGEFEPEHLMAKRIEAPVSPKE